MEDVPLMERALTLAREGLGLGAMPIGAVLARNGEIVAESFWKGTGHGLLEHPESVVLRESDRLLDFAGRREATLYTTLEPCLMCMGTAMSFFLGRVVYALPAPPDGAAAVADAWAPALGHPRSGGPYAVPAIEGGLLEAESRRLIGEWLDAGAHGPEADYARRLLGAA